MTHDASRDESLGSYSPAAHYDRVTEAWGLLLGEDLHYGVFGVGDEPLPVATAALTDLMIEHARLRPGIRLLDVGCGTGAPACRLASEQGVHVLGITTSEIGVTAATERARSQGLEGVSFEVRDGTASGLVDATFDVVWVMESSHLMSEREALLTEAARLLRPGGRFVLCDIIRRRDIPFLEVRDRREDLAVLRRAFGAARMDKLGEYATYAQVAGLVVDEMVDLTSATLPTFDRWQANVADHRATVADSLAEADIEAFERSCDILRGFWLDGTLGYGLITADKPA
ncbi:SAM-dependent methyltransferase [Aeromicrobium sp.]|uniref:SAM-dependent methyltransferase n=1 Tax=Aeromicrobium sp. TaxID=1871063 RepID=UPI003C5AE649